MPSIELLQVVLGLQPYVLVQYHIDDDGELAAKINAGGGIPDVEGIRGALELALGSLPGASAERTQPDTGAVPE